VSVSSLILLTTGGLAREVLNVVDAAGCHRVIGFLDDETTLHGTSVDGVPVLGPIEEAVKHTDARFVVCAGRGQSRRGIVRRLQSKGLPPDRYAAVVDPTVRVPRGCSIGDGAILLAQTVLTADVHVGRHVVAMPHVTLTHDNRIDDFATLCAQVVLGGSVYVGEAAYLGMGSSVREGIAIGTGATLGMGAVLLEDLPAGATWAGCPARPLERPVTYLEKSELNEHSAS
jgi:sugar O-acyltransferase (sialic acid O-acetyltransferase NeuD family)